MSKYKMAKFAGIVGFGTFISRILGYVRDMAIAYSFPKVQTDTFFLAFRIPNLLRGIFGEGAMNAAFIPVFTEHLKTKDKKEAWRLASNIINIVVIILACAVVLFFLFAPYIVSVIAPGFLSPEKAEMFDLTVLLTRIMIPFMIFVGIGALIMAILNTFEIFALPALAPAILNLFMIGAVFTVCRQYAQNPIIGLAWGVLAGELAQLLFQTPPLLKIKYRHSFEANFKYEGVKKIFRLITPALLGWGVLEINLFVDNFIASFLDVGSISALYYSNRLVQLPLAIFGTAAYTAILPTLSKYAVEKNMEEFRSTYSFGVRMVFILAIPSTAMLIGLGEPIIQVLFLRGKFDEVASHATLWALMLQSIGLFAFTGEKVTIPAFYSLQDTKTPVKIAVTTMAVNIILNIILFFTLARFKSLYEFDIRLGGIVLATTLSHILNFSLLTIFLRKRINGIDGKRIFVTLIKAGIASAIMGVLSWALYVKILTPLLPGGFAWTLINLSLSVCAGGLLFIVIGYLLKIEEISNLKKILSRKLSSKES